jgi:hypothetical protein
MTLKTDFFDGATGIHSQMNDTFDLGVAFVVASAGTLTSAMTTSAASGVTTFTVTIETLDNPANLRLDGLYQQHYFAGIIKGLADEDVYSHEVSLALNTTNTTTTGVDFNFTF